MQFTYPEEASKEASRKHDCNAVVKWLIQLWMVVVGIDYNSCKMQNKPHCSEVDNTEHSYLLRLVKEAICNKKCCPVEHLLDALYTVYHKQY